MKEVLCFKEHFIPTLYTVMELQEVCENMK